MGIRGLKTFIEGNDDLLIHYHRLHDCSLIIDANNLVSSFLEKSQSKHRADLFGSDIVLFARYLDNLFDTFQKCNIKPVLVFDGAQPSNESRDKTATRLRRCQRRLKNVMNINKFGGGDVVVPTISAMVTKSVACTWGITIAQAMFEADDEVARLAHIHKSPILSNDSDFYLFDLPEGVLSFTMFDYERPYKCPNEGYYYINCSIYKRSRFARFFPGLDSKCLPLLGVLAGNDFVDPQTFEELCRKLPNYQLKDSVGFGQAYNLTRNFEKIFKILYSLCGRSLNANVDFICQKFPIKQRKGWKDMIQKALKLYKIPTEDQFLRELINLTRDGYYSTRSCENLELLEIEFKSVVMTLERWLKNSMEHSILMRRALEIIHRNMIFIRPQMDDTSLPSSHLCQKQCIEVFLQLTRISPDDIRPCEIYDREGKKYSSFLLYPVKFLEGFGPLDFLIFDIPTLPQDTRQRILLATFNCLPGNYDNHVKQHTNLFDEENAKEFSTIKIIFEYIDKISSVKLLKRFKRSTLLCYIYYLAAKDRDSKFSIKNPQVERFLKSIQISVKRDKFDLAPLIGKNQVYNCRLMHQINQLQTSLYSYNLLNAFLGCPSTLFKFEYWLNSCFIYNFTEYRRPDTGIQSIEEMLNC